MSVSFMKPRKFKSLMSDSSPSLTSGHSYPHLKQQDKEKEIAPPPLSFILKVNRPITTIYFLAVAIHEALPKDTFSEWRTGSFPLYMREGLKMSPGYKREKTVTDEAGVGKAGFTAGIQTQVRKI